MCRIIICSKEHRDEIIGFLREVEKQLPCPLTGRTNIADFTDKVLEHGMICGAFDEEKLIGAALFYCNDSIKRTAYLTMLGVLPDSGNKGVGSSLIEKVEELSRKNGMSGVKLTTNITNTRAVAFYKKNGYSITEQVTDGEEQKYILTKRL